MDASGNLNVSVWGSQPGYYDMVLDVDCNGKYNAYRDSVDCLVGGEEGFYIYPEAATIILILSGLSLIYEYMRIRKRKN